VNVGVTGATGFVGKALMAALLKHGHTGRAISARGFSAEMLAGCQAVVNLAGEPIAQRWTAEVKERIRSSRVDGTRALVAAMRTHRPQVLINASAVGYYGSRGDTILTEAAPAANDFLGQTCREWEDAAVEAEGLGVRGARLRLGVVLGRDGGALQTMLPPFRLGLGGPIAGGAQWMSWIHIDDLIALIMYLLSESTVRGVFNAVSPNPVTNAEFSKALGHALHRPAFMPVPAFAVKLLFGEMAEVVLASQRAIPDAAIRAGFTFEYTDIFGTLAHCVA
jgi:uncharacterized protein